MIKRIYLFLFFTLCLSSCSFQYDGQGNREFITGECLQSNELSHIRLGSLDRDKLVYCFGLDFANLKIEKEKGESIFHIKPLYREVPSDKVFQDNFGSKSKAVKAEFERVYDDCYYKFENEVMGESSKLLQIATILYNGGLSLTCNEDFAGVKAGENLASLIRNYYNGSNDNGILTDPFYTSSKFGKCLDMGGLPYISILDKAIGFSINTEGCEVVSDDVKFELKVPVKVVMYLHWLESKMSDPDAEIPYSDEVLTCTFPSKIKLVKQ